MTNVNYIISEEHSMIEVEGHSGYAEAGNDIVCSAISILVQTLEEHLDRICDTYNADIKPGRAEITAEGAKAKECFEFTVTGLRLIENSFPRYISVTNRGAL